MAFYDLMFNQSRPREAIERYAGEHYIQHNRTSRTGRTPSSTTSTAWPVSTRASGSSSSELLLKTTCSAPLLSAVAGRPGLRRDRHLPLRRQRNPYRGVVRNGSGGQRQQPARRSSCITGASRARYLAAFRGFARPARIAWLSQNLRFEERFGEKVVVHHEDSPDGRRMFAIRRLPNEDSGSFALTPSTA